MFTNTKRLLLISFIVGTSILIPEFAFSQGLEAQRNNGSPQASPVAAIGEWFAQYDEIRRNAQMSPAEKQQADALLGKGLAMFMPGQDKVLAQQLLSDLVQRYEMAVRQLSQLQIVPATEQLQRGYYRYFTEAHNLFSDYLRLQNDLLAVDPATGQPLASTLIDRKQSLEQLDQYDKSLDGQIRAQYGIPPYRY